MKSPPIRIRAPRAGDFSGWFRSVLSAAGGVLATLVAHPGTGALDAGFAPVASELAGRREFIVVGDACHGFDILTPEIRRYGDDGRWDGTAIVVDDGRPGVTTTIHWLTATPWGGLWARGSVGIYAFDGLGMGRPLSFAGGRALPEMSPLLPLEDGGWVTSDLTRFSNEGVRDPSFARACWLEFGPPNGRSLVQQVIRDPQGRLLAIGNFVKSGPETRLGIVRVLPDGRPDPGFDPAEALGIAITEGGVLSGQPLSLALGKDGSIYLEANGGAPNRRLAQLDDRGGLIRWIDLDVSGFLLPPLIQPDGRILLGGTFDRWSDRPVTSLIRLLPDGTLDESFQVELGDGPNRGSLMGMELDARGRLWIHGGFDRVNGTERPGLARLLAYDPPGAPPEIRSTVSRPRIATNEVLYLAAEVRGDPPPELQWMRDGQPVPGATHRVLQLPVDAGTSLGSFHLVARNAGGVQELEFPRVTLGVRSPLAGQLDPDFDVSLGRLPDPQILMPLPDGRLWITSRWLASGAAEEPMLGRLRADGTWDASFGADGVVHGNGVVQAVLPLADGGVLVGGTFTRMAGAGAHGLLELDPQGRPIPRPWPDLDVSEVTALARQPDGKLLIAGLFRRVGSRDAYHLVRLDSQGQPDPEFGSPLAPGQVVERMQTDSEGRILVAGLRASADAPFPNFEALGLQRLLSDGSRDPAFVAGANRWNEFFILPGDSLLVGLPPQPLDSEGGRQTAFDLADLSVPGVSLPRLPGFQMILLPGGGVIAPASRRSDSQMELVRWHANGTLDDTFQLVFGLRFDSPPEVRSMVATPGGAVLVALMDSHAANPDAVHRLRRLLPDPDTVFSNARLVDNRLDATVATQRGATYEIYLRSRLDAPNRTRVDAFDGDGYLRTVALPVTPGDDQQFLELVRRRRL
ncbi:MAG: hypothetical protein J0L84_01885 [Verrucomicrobia bacterium]|nr:hypothetical protein [Verrucomicrobiota bacterium]